MKFQITWFKNSPRWNCDQCVLWTEVRLLSFWNLRLCVSEWNPCNACPSPHYVIFCGLYIDTFREIYLSFLRETASINRSKLARYTTSILHVFRKSLRIIVIKMPSGEVAWYGYMVSLIKYQFSFGSINLFTAEAMYIRNYENTPNIYGILWTSNMHSNDLPK